MTTRSDCPVCGRFGGRGVPHKRQLDGTSVPCPGGGDAADYAGVVDQAAKPKANAGLQTRILLERGHPGEILPWELERVREKARRYISDPSLPDDARARVQAVWLDGEYRAAHIAARSDG